MILMENTPAWYEHVWVWVSMSTIASFAVYFLLLTLTRWRTRDLDKRISTYQFFAILFSVLSLITSWMWFYYFGVISTFPAWIVALLFTIEGIRKHGFTKKNKGIFSLLLLSLSCMLYGIYVWFIA